MKECIDFILSGENTVFLSVREELGIKRTGYVTTRGEKLGKQEKSTNIPYSQTAHNKNSLNILPKTYPDIAIHSNLLPHTYKDYILDKILVIYRFVPYYNGTRTAIQKLSAVSMNFL